MRLNPVQLSSKSLQPPWTYCENCAFLLCLFSFSDIYVSLLCVHVPQGPHAEVRRHLCGVGLSPSTFTWFQGLSSGHHACMASSFFCWAFWLPHCLSVFWRQGLTQPKLTWNLLNKWGLSLTSDLFPFKVMSPEIVCVCAHAGVLASLGMFRVQRLTTAGFHCLSSPWLLL